MSFVFHFGFIKNEWLTSLHKLIVLESTAILGVGRFDLQTKSRNKAVDKIFGPNDDEE